MKRLLSFDELESVVGTHLGHSDWHEITQTQIDAFAEATGDRQWIHVDPAKAGAGPFQSTIAHGYLTLSLVPKLVWQVYKVEGASMSVNYGADRVRLPAPVPVGSMVCAGIELASVNRVGNDCRVVAEVAVERDGANKPACVVDLIGLLVR
jgi:acyl dehydratase